MRTHIINFVQGQAMPLLVYLLVLILLLFMQQGC